MGNFFQSGNEIAGLVNLSLEVGRIHNYVMFYKSPVQQPEPSPTPDGRKTNAAATQAALKAAGRRLFGELGFDGTALAALCQLAEVTTGALYHHFGDKKGLFAAVAEDLDAALVGLATTARDRALTAGGTPWDGFMAAIDAFLEAGLDPLTRRIGLTDAPAVLGASAWLEIRERHGLGAMVHTVSQLQALGLLPQGDARLRARLILGLLYGAVEALAPNAPNTEDHETALADRRQLVHAMLDGMRTAAR
jgi:AcrR family transcriptional regulator